MTHGDDNGLVCPPRLARYQVVIVPIYRTDEQRAGVVEAAERIQGELQAAGIRVHLDSRDGMKPGAKYYEWEGRGTPLRIELGPRDLEAGTVVVAKRTGGKESVPMEGLAANIDNRLEALQRELFEAARDRREANSLRGATREEFREFIAGDGGFVYAGWCGSEQCEADIKADTKATIRVLPDEEFRSAESPSACVWCGKPSVVEAVWAKAY
jgi:prolyl-tRNA synthetase